LDDIGIGVDGASEAPLDCAGAVAKAEASPMSGDLCQARLAAHFSSSRQAQLLGGLSAIRDGHWHETVRVFIVHPDWPSTDSG
jgi:hypothetical protein